MRDTISLREATRIIDAGEVFTCTCVKYDRKRQTGGQLFEITAQLAKIATDRGDTPIEAAEAKERKAQNHHVNFTRNVALVVDDIQTALIRKIHPPLMLTFNNKIVMP